MNPIVSKWFDDPKFAGLPENIQRRAIGAFFDDKVTDAAFSHLPGEQQARVRATFVNEHMRPAAPEASAAAAPPRGILDESVSSLTSGLASVLEAGAGTAEMILPEGLGKQSAGDFRQALQRTKQSEYLRRPDNLAEGTVLEHPERLSDWHWWVRALGENIPNMAAMMIPGMGAVKAGKVLGMGANAIKWAGRLAAWSGAATIEAGYAYGQAKDEMKASGQYTDDKIESIAGLEGLSVGVVNGILEMLPFDNLFLRGSGVDNILKRIVRQAVVEGGTETAQEAVSILAEKLGHKPEQRFRDNVGRLLESGLIGGVLGAGAGVVAGPEELPATEEKASEKPDEKAAPSAAAEQPMSQNGAGPAEVDPAVDANREAAHKAKVRQDAEDMLASVLSEQAQEEQTGEQMPAAAAINPRVAPVRTDTGMEKSGAQQPSQQPVLGPAEAPPESSNSRVAPMRTTAPEIQAQVDADIMGVASLVEEQKQDGEQEAAGQVHDYSSTQVDLKPQDADAVRSYAAAIPEEELHTKPEDSSYGREDNPHITVKYGLDTSDPAAVAPALSGSGPVKVRLGKVSIFEADEYDVVKVDVDSADLRRLNKKIGKKVEAPGETFKNYKPHVTIAYVKKGEGHKYVGDTTFEGREMTFDRMTLTAKDGSLHSLELSAKPKSRTAGAASLTGRKGPKFEKALADYRAYVSGLSDTQRAQVADLIEDAPKSPSQSKLKIQKALAANVVDDAGPKISSESTRTTSEVEVELVAHSLQTGKEEVLRVPKTPSKAAPRRGQVGDRLAAGEIVLTTTGRQTTPFPKIDTSTPRKEKNTIRRVDRWLMGNAAAEARDRGDNFNLRQFEALKDVQIHQADKDGAEQYLFGEQQPPVVRSVLKPLSPAAKSIGARPKVKKKATQDVPKGYGESNKVFTKESADAARELLKKKLGQLNTGLDPEIVQAGIQLAGYHIEAGARSFAAYTKAMIQDLGEAVRPYLRGWYEAVRFYPGFDAAGMSTAEEIEAAGSSSPTAKKPLTGKASGPINGAEKEADDGTIRPSTENPPEGVRTRGVRADESGRGAGPVLRDAGQGGPGAKADADGKRAAGLHGRRDRYQRPANAVDYTITPADELGQGGPKTKFKDNVAAIRLLAELEKRPVTSEDQSILVKYVGWGGLPQAFVRPDGSVAKGWESEVAELKELLGDADYAAARSTTQDAHYTSEPVVRAIYDAIGRIGFKAGKILEPAVGTGNFIGLMPKSVRSRSHITGVEIDPTTARIAKHLYPKQRIVHAGFEEFSIVPDSFDLAIGNPPFGDKKLYDSQHKELKGFSIHNYFFAKSLIGLRPNGILAMVVSSHMMDKQGGAQRAWIAERADLLGAIRLPNSAFKSTAGTEVTTDIIFLRKRMAGEKPAGPSWQALKQVQGRDHAYRINKYFAEHPEMMLGDLAPNKLLPAEVKDGVYQGAPGLAPRAGSDLAADIAAAVAALPADVYRTGKTMEEVQRPKIMVSDPGFAQPFGYTLDDEGLAVRRLPDENGEMVFEPALYAGKPLEGRRLERFKGMLEVRDALRRLVRAEIEDETAERLDALREDLNRVYDRFVAAHGLISTSANSSVLASDPTDLPLLRSLELEFDAGVSAAVAKRTGETPRAPSAKKAAIFRVRTREPYRAATSAKDARDGLAVVLREGGVVDMRRIATLAGISEEQAAVDLDGLVFLDPDAETWQTKDAYLSGNVKEKLATARQAAAQDDAYSANVRALEGVQPEDVPVDLISFRIGATWMPTRLYEDFAANVLQSAVAVDYLEEVGTWSVRAPRGGTTPFDTPGMKGAEIYSRLLQSRDLTVYKEMADGSRQVDMEASTVAKSKAEEMDRGFQEWALSDLARRDEIARTFNEKVNTTVPAKFDGSHMIFPGMGIITVGVARDNQLLSHQKNVVWRLIQKGKGLVDHVVGSGKTFLSIAAGLEMKRMGLVKKPMYVVPNHLVQQWALDFQRLYPGANVLVIGKKDFAKSRRQEFMGRIATGDWDAVVIAHSSFGFIKMPFEYERRFYLDQVRQYERAIEELAAAEGKKSRSVKQMEKAKDRLKTKLEALADKPKDAVVDFSELGVDALFVDEAHEFKNLFYATKRTRVAGLGNPEGSKKAFDLFVKSQYILENNNDKGVFFLTGTPVSNSISEMYTMMRYLIYDRMKKMGIRHFDQWSNLFASAVSDWEVDPTGTRYRLQSKLDFVNLPGLMALYKDFADVVSTADLQAWAKERGEVWPIPDVKGGKPENVVAERSDLQKSFMEWIVHRFDNMPSDPRKDNPLKATGEAMKAALDIRLIDPSLPDHPGSKINLAVDRLMRVYEQWSEEKGTQLVFCDLSVPNQSRGRQASEIGALREKLRALEKRLTEETDPEALMEVENEYSRLSEKMAKYSPAELMAAESKFSVYDDLKAKLVARGIPEAEVAFIHDANTEQQKEDLFARVRTGRVRILIGSTSKMGAGMNVQNKLVALHHLDAPWRPSDLEQREGRIIRQGNEFYREALKAGKKFEVEIYRYATKETLDTRRWQIIERKAKTIEALRSGAHAWGDTIADAMGEATNAAEMKAASSGNPLILKEIQVRKQIEKLEAQKRGERSQRMEYERKLRMAEEFETNYDDLVEDVAADRKLIEAHPRDNSPQGWQVAVNGQVFEAEGLVPVPGNEASKEEIKAAEKHNADALKDAKARFKAALDEALEPFFEKKFTSAPYTEITLRGVNFAVLRSSFGVAVEFVPDLEGSEAYSYGMHGADFQVPISEGYSPEGLLVRMHNRLDRVAADGDAVQARLDARLAREQKTAEIARKELAKGRDSTGELESLRAEHARILSELQADKDKLPPGQKDFSQWTGGAGRSPRGGGAMYSDLQGSGRLSIEDVREVFKGQAVSIDPDGPDVFRVRMKNGRALEIRRVEHIDPDRAAIALAYGEIKDDGRPIAGKFQDGRIEIARDVGDKWTLTHESVHFMETAGLLTHADVVALRKHIRQLAANGKWETMNADDIGGSEDRAAFVAESIRQRSHVRGAVGRILQKVRDLVDRLVNLVRRTAAGVVRDIESGDIFDRSADESSASSYYKIKDLSIPQFSVVSRPQSGPAVTRDLEKDRTFVNKLHEMADVARENVSAATAKLQTRVQELTGAASRRKLPLGFAYNRKVKESMASRRLDQAMFFYRDAGGDLSKFDDFSRQAAQGIADGTIKGAHRVYVESVQKALETARSLSDEQKAFVDEMGDRFEAAYQIAEENKVIQSHVDNYVRRVYKRRKADADAAVYSGWTGGGHGFRVSHGAAQMRRYDTALDAILAGYELGVSGLTNAFDNYMGELVTVLANRAFIKQAMHTTDASGRKLFTTNTNKVPGYEDYKELKAPGFAAWQLTGTIAAADYADAGRVMETNSWGRQVFITQPEHVPKSWAVYKPSGIKPSKVFYDNPLYDAKAAAAKWASDRDYTDIRERPAKDVSSQFQKQKLYTPAPIAEMINKMTATDPLFASTPALKALARLNAGVKSWVLMTSFFHHLAGARSWVFGVHHGWGRGKHVVVSEDGSRVLGEFRSLEDARQAAGEQNGRVVERTKAAPWRAYKAGLDKVYDLHPLVSRLVKNGLTLGELQDWSESALRDDGGLTERLVKHFGWTKAAGVVEHFRFTREKWANSLFKKYFAGLKSEAAVIEYVHELSRTQELYTAGKGAAPDADKIAERVARLINADFGGLHLKRMGRNPTLQLIARLLLLAPDWTESNFRTVTGMVPGLNEKISRFVGDVPPPAGMDTVYRHFWGRVALRVAMATIVAQLLLNGKDDSEEFIKEQMLSNRFNKFRWTEVDVSRLYKMLGIDLEGQRKTFSIGGHFFDPLKLLDPWRLIKGKASPAVRALGAGFSGTDWADRPFTGVAELVTTGHTVKKSAFEDVEGGFNRLPATVVNQVINMQPIQLGHLMRYFQGEEDGLSALMQSIGAHVHTAWQPKATQPIEDVPGFADVAAEVDRLQKAGVLHMAPPARTVTIGGMPVRMGTAQYDDYLRRSSEAAARRLKAMVASPGYRTWSDEKRAAKVRAVIENARSRARKKIRRVLKRAA